MQGGSNGWIKLHRKITEKGYYKNSKYVHLWVHLLLKANHKPAEFMWNKKIIIIKEGQLITGRKQLRKETGISESSVERILSLLENEHQIEQQKTTKFRLITVINWKSYQFRESVGQQNEQQADNRRTTSGQQTDTNKNDKNNNNEKNDKNIIAFETFWNSYDKKVGDKGKIEKKWNQLSLSVQQLIISYIPKYKKAQPDKQYRKNPDTFLNQKGWEHELIYSNKKTTGVDSTAVTYKTAQL